MSLVGFISRRFNASAYMPRSIRTMRIVAITGIAIAVAALIIATAIGRGFEREYKAALMNFNAHIAVLGTGELDDPDEAMNELRAFERRGEDERKFLERWEWFLPIQSRFSAIANSVIRFHEGVSDELFEYPRIDDLWQYTDPRLFLQFIPESITDGMRKLNDRASRSIEAMTPFIYREALAVGDGNIRGVVVKGIEPDTFSNVGGARIDLSGASKDLRSAFVKGNNPKAILGRALAEKLGVESHGGSFKLLVPQETDNIDGSSRFRLIDVAGTFESGMHDYDDQFLLMSIDTVRSLFGAPKGAASGIELKLTDPEKATYTAAAIEDELGFSYRAVTWSELNRDLLSAVNLEKLVSGIVMGIMVVVASLNIVTVLVLLMIHRVPEISILRAMGLKDRAVASTFISGGMSIALWGVGIGLAAGIGISACIGRLRLIPLEAEIYLIESLPIDISPMICGMLALFCLGMGFITSRFASGSLNRLPICEGLEGQ